MRIISCSLELLIDVVDATLRCGHFPFFPFHLTSGEIIYFFFFTGVQESIIECIRELDGVRVSPHLCPMDRRPDARATTSRARQGGTRQTFLHATGRAAAARWEQYAARRRRPLSPATASCLAILQHDRLPGRVEDGRMEPGNAVSCFPLSLSR